MNASRYCGRAMWTLAADFDAFYLEHRRCGRLDADVENGRVWMTCECEAVPCRSLRKQTRCPVEGLS